MTMALMSPMESLAPSGPPAVGGGDARPPKPADEGLGSAKPQDGRGDSSIARKGAQAPDGGDEDSSPTEGEASGTVEKARDAVQDVASQLREQLGVSLEFEVDQELDRAIVRVRNPETEEVIRQIPPEAMLDMARHLREDQGGAQGVLLDVQR